MRHEIGGHAGAVVLDRDLERQADARLAPRHRQAHARPDGGGERDLTVGPLLADLDLARETGPRDLLYVIEHVMNVDRLAQDRSLVAENLHAVDELADAIG